MYCQRVRFKVLLHELEFYGRKFQYSFGKELRMRRLSLGLAQTKVAQAINVTFQQIQKYREGYERYGSND